jgi:hypothetical protein
MDGLPFWYLLQGAEGQPPYLWSVVGGELPPGLALDTDGMLSGMPDTPGQYDFAIQMSDQFGDTASADIQVTVDPYTPGLLLDSTYGNNSLAGWRIVDAPGANSAPSQWSAASGALAQSSNIMVPDPAALTLRGTHAVYDAGATWSDYRLSLDMRSSDDDLIGAMVRVGDSNNHYRFWWSAQSQLRRLDKTVGGVTTVLAEQRGVAYQVSRSYRLEILAQGSLLEVRIDGALIFSVIDADLTTGTVALYSYGNDGSRFDNMRVEDVGGTPVNLPPQITTLSVPATLADDTTAVFSVSASDPDGDAQSLRYAWSVTPAEGTLSGADTATAQYTPADISGSRTYSVSISVTDEGGATTTDSRTLTVEDADAPPVVLEDSFDDRTFAGWRIVDAPGARSAPSRWSAASGALVQSSNILVPDPAALSLRGTHAVYDAGATWSDYRLSLDMSSSDDDLIGAMVRVGDSDNHYRFWWSAQQAMRRLDKTVGGVTTVLAEQRSVAYQVGRSYRLEIPAQGSLLEVRIDGALVFSVTDGDIITGTVALYSYGNQGSRFDNVRVE